MAEADSTPETEEQASLDSALSEALRAYGEEMETPGGEAEPEAEPVQTEAGSGAESENVDESAEANTPAAEGDGEASSGGEQALTEPPDDWPADQKERFQQLDETGRQIVLEQYKNFQKGFTQKSQQLSEEARFAEAVRKEFEPFQDQLKMQGMDEQQAIRQLVALHNYASQNPTGYVRWFMDQAGIDPESLTKGEQGEDEPLDPEVKQLREKVAQLEQQATQAQQSQQQQAAQALQQQIQEFAQATDEQGNAKHPHFEEVQDTMARLLQAGEAQGLEDAYNKAVWADPDLRQKQLEAERQRKADEEARRQREEAEKAKRAGRNPKGSNTAQTRPAATDLDSIIEDATQRHGL